MQIPRRFYVFEKFLKKFFQGRPQALLRAIVPHTAEDCKRDPGLIFPERSCLTSRIFQSTIGANGKR